ncbi:MAG TPA: DNA repair protein RecO [Beijerinckiaceae bacterium]|nr:DNA repair protein RecO [Beijerinckiaceae bacterium]
MDWHDDGIIIGLRRHGETSVIVEAMTRSHGRHLGLVRGGRGRRHAPVLQPGNTVDLVWRARLDEHLGQYQVEPLVMRSRFLDSAAALYALSVVSGHLRLLPERDPHEALYEAATVIFDHADDPATACALIARFERALLGDLGFGLDLDACAATGAAADLIYVSPKSGRAVSRDAGAPYADRLLALPDFLRNGGTSPMGADLAAAFRLTGHFLERHVFEPRGLSLPDQRAALLALAVV